MEKRIYKTAQMLKLIHCLFEIFFIVKYCMLNREIVNLKSKIFHYQLSIINYQLSIFNFQLNQVLHP